MSKLLLVDVDCGVDDAQAIMLALKAPNVKILGITCVHGNTSVENVCKNTLRILHVCEKLEVGAELLHAITSLFMYELKSWKMCKSEQR